MTLLRGALTKVYSVQDSIAKTKQRQSMCFGHYTVVKDNYVVIVGL